MDLLLDADQTAARLPYGALAREVRELLADPAVEVPERLVQPLPGGGSLFVMPALDGRIAITKLITFTPANAGTALPSIQGDVVVFDVRSGRRMLVLDGPTITARRTAAVSLLAAQALAPNPAG
ncbi:MAG TPA: delta(1)-pyrroline-2-carboxylate reductase family protein, partial [Ramlibacter sp.]|nr:delta(1)-pyrroline-2-carboxylate reductase family protein [Ramlibacter sp.]